MSNISKYKAAECETDKKEKPKHHTHRLQDNATVKFFGKREKPLSANPFYMVSLNAGQW